MLVRTPHPPAWIMIHTRFIFIPIFSFAVGEKIPLTAMLDWSLFEIFNASVKWKWKCFLLINVGLVCEVKYVCFPASVTVLLQMQIFSSKEIVLKTIFKKVVYFNTAQIDNLMVQISCCLLGLLFFVFDEHPSQTLGGVWSKHWNKYWGQFGEVCDVFGVADWKCFTLTRNPKNVHI